jgi:signal transduction histidine kinase/ActR/RegA family two-component response regulator
VSKAPDLPPLIACLQAIDQWEQPWPEEICRGVLEAALEELGAFGGAIYRMAVDQCELLFASPDTIAPPSPDGLLPDAAKDRLFTHTIAQEAGGEWLAALAWSGLPGEKVALILRSPPELPPDPDRLAHLGALLALAAQTGQLRRARAREARQNELLFRVSQAFMSTVDLRALLDLIVSLVAETLERAENCVLHLLDPDSDLLVAMSVSNEARASTPGPEETPLRSGVGAAGLALMTGQVINIGDVARDGRFLVRPTSGRIVSLLTAPLIVRGQPIGTLTVDSSVPFAFGEEDERLLMPLASLAAAAINNADLVKNLQESLDELRDTQAQLLQSEKLSAIGQLIAGITHEINNPLAAISGYAQLLKMSEDIDPQTRQDVTRIYEQAQRAARIVRNLLTFAREHRAMRRPTDVNVLLQKSLELLAYQLRIEGISVELQLAPQCMGVMGDPYQLQQVFFNLIGNARDAMAEAHDGGRLTVKTESVGSTVRIQICDTGPGLSAEARKHLFEPFFTTKEVGKGTGLGLSICFGIISEHAGRIYLAETSEPGATFVVELPLTSRLPDFDEDMPLEEMTFLANRLVLLVEDEEPIARVVQRVLTRDGHRSVVTRDGNEALSYLERARERGAPFDLIVSDIKMPNMDGAELYEHIQREYPEMADRVLFMTGDSVSPSTRAFLGDHGLPFLIKPFDLGELRQAINSSLR